MHKVRNTEVMVAFGSHLRNLRKRAGLSQEDLAFKSDLALSSIARIETGRLNTSISTVVVLAKALGIDKKELFDF